MLSRLSPAATKILTFGRYTSKRELHSRNKKAIEHITKGFAALKEVDRIVGYTKPHDDRLYPLLLTAKTNFELALESDNSNANARYWLARLHLFYYSPGACKDVGAALLMEAADMGDPDAQYELANQLRADGGYQQAFDQLQKAVDQLHPGALYLMGTIYLTGDSVEKDISKALWCFYRASEKGHPGAAIAYGALLLRGVEVPERLTRFVAKKRPTKEAVSPTTSPLELARKRFEIAAKAGCDLGFRWLKRLEEEEKMLELSAETGFTDKGSGKTVAQ